MEYNLLPVHVPGLRDVASGLEVRGPLAGIRGALGPTDEGREAQVEGEAERLK